MVDLLIKKNLKLHQGNLLIEFFVLVMKQCILLITKCSLLLTGCDGSGPIRVKCAFLIGSLAVNIFPY